MGDKETSSGLQTTGGVITPRSPERDIDRDLGFGSVVSSRHNYRLLNRDGSFNVRVLNGPFFDRFFSYHKLLTISWPAFFAIIALGYLALNAIFASIYLACGPDALRGDANLSGFDKAFFFSVHTFATIGYGNVIPGNLAANVVVTVESLFGLMLFAIATGLVFARFSRPVADVMYARYAVIGPYRDGLQGFKFRVVNRRQSQLVNVEAVVTMSRFEETAEGRSRKFYQLKLERSRVIFFPLNWTVVHAIDEQSPMFGWTSDRLRAAETEFYIALTGVDETFAQTVHSRSSYTMEDVKCDENYQMMYFADDGEFVLDLNLLSATERKVQRSNG